MTDQLASARGHLKNARNQAATVRSVGVHPAREAHVEGKLVESADYIENEINAALEAIESVENAEESVQVSVSRESLLRSILDSPPPFDWDAEKTLYIVRGDKKVGLRITGSVDWDDPLLRGRLRNSGAIEPVEPNENDGDYYVLTPDCATLNDATRFDREIDAVLVGAAHHEPVEVVHRPNRP